MVFIVGCLSAEWFKHSCRATERVSGSGKVGYGHFPSCKARVTPISVWIAWNVLRPTGSIKIFSPIERRITEHRPPFQHRQTRRRQWVCSPLLSIHWELSQGADSRGGLSEQWLNVERWGFEHLLDSADTVIGNYGHTKIIYQNIVLLIC